MTTAWKQWEGQVVDRKFQLRHYLGSSDTGAVFLSEHREQGIPRAVIKLIPTMPENAELRLSRWKQAMQLSHPHLLRLFQMGRCQLGNMFLLYVVMECADESLSQILPRRPLTPAEAREMLEPALDALAYIHGQGFVHGHIRPTNIMAIGDRLKLSSDGLCRVDEQVGGPRKRGPYDPPEASSGIVSPAADVWALGVTLVEALAQHRPTLEGVRGKNPVLPEKLPEPFLDIARNCLRPDPKDRWTLAQIRERLRQPTPVPQKQAVAKLKVATLKWHYIIPAAAVVMALGAILIGINVFKSGPEGPPPLSTAPVQPRVPAKQEQVGLKSDASSPAQKPNEKKQIPVAAPPSPASLHPEANTKAGQGNVVPGEVKHQVVPDVPQKALDTIRGTLRLSVRVSVDQSGNVAEASFDAPGPSKYFADFAMRAARQWKFEPAKMNGQPLTSEWILRFEFVNAGAKVFPTRATP